MRIKQLFFAFFLPMMAFGQSVAVMVGSDFVTIPVQQTQTELKPGWTIVDIKLKDKLVHYLYGAHSTQLADDRQPLFLVTPGEKEILSDYVIIRLQTKKTYRKLPKSTLRENAYTRVDPNAFNLKSDGKDGFICQPTAPLEKGEYILLNINQTPIGNAQDLLVFPFQIR